MVRLGDKIIHRPVDGGKVQVTKVERIERRLCGIHINHSLCFNQPEDTLEIER